MLHTPSAGERRQRICVKEGLDSDSLVVCTIRRGTHVPCTHTFDVDEGLAIPPGKALPALHRLMPSPC